MRENPCQDATGRPCPLSPVASMPTSSGTSILPGSADIVVIGGGIMGASIARNLARRRAGQVLLLERRTVAAGASGRTGALLLQHYTNRPEATLAHRSLQTFHHWADEIGGDCGLDPCGVVVTVDMQGDLAGNLERMHANVAMQNDVGIASRVITPADLQSLQPHARVDDLLAAAWEERSGYADPIASTRSMALAAIREGARIVENVAVEEIETDGDRVVAVRTASGRVVCGTVVLAAGPWSTALAATAGVTLPIEALRVQVAILQRPLDFQDSHSVFLDTAVGIFTRPWGPGRTMMGVAGGDQHDAVDPDDFREQNDPGYAAQAIAAGARRFPALARASYVTGQVGLYDMTPDAHPIIGQAGPQGLWICAGFSGAGFKKGPAVGECLAEQITEGRSSIVDLGPFAFDRFATDAWKQPWSDTEYLMSTDFGHGL
jgi:sarcosine oxidase, subunit beta